jgi:hypothetical protein
MPTTPHDATRVQQIRHSPRRPRPKRPRPPTPMVLAAEGSYQSQLRVHRTASTGDRARCGSRAVDRHVITETIPTGRDHRRGEGLGGTIGPHDRVGTEQTPTSRRPTGTPTTSTPPTTDETELAEPQFTLPRWSQRTSLCTSTTVEPEQHDQRSSSINATQ